MTRRVAIVQARMSSTRFPGKVLMPLGGVPMIAFMWNRLLAARRLDDAILATSDHPSDDALAEEAAKRGIRCFRGSLDDVLGRFLGAALSATADVVVRLTGDCPLIDPDVVDSVLAALDREHADYASNVAPPTFPDGLDVEAFTMDALQRAAREASLDSQREHVTPFMRDRKDLFQTALVRSPVDLSALRWTVDYPDDLDRVRALVLRTTEGPDARAGMPDRFDFLRAMSRDDPNAERVAHVRNEGYMHSLEKDASRT